MPKRLDIIGNKYGRLLVKSYLEQNKHGKSVWECQCDCGKVLSVLGPCLTRGTTTSCGCLKSENMTEYNTTHGMKGTRTYNCWNNMKSRCKYEDRWDAEYYALKGVSYDPRWESFEKFFEDMGEAPEGMSIDRIDPNLDYCKENCRWADDSLQAFNQGIRSNNTSGKTGVWFTKRTGKWTASITHELQREHLGNFDSLQEAIKAREEAELKYYGFIKE